MAQFNNQMTIIINKDYSWVEYTDTMKACRALNGAAFKMYIYLSSYSCRDTVDFSPQSVGEELGIGVSTARNAFNELVRENFLIKKDTHTFIFSGKQKL